MSIVVPEFHLDRPKHWWQRTWVIVAAVVLLIAVLSGGGIVYMNHWYNQNTKPLSSQSKAIRVTINSGMDAQGIGDLLAKQKIIRSGRAFSWYVGHHSDKSNLRAGTYLLSPSYSVQKIVDMLVSGDIDSYNITFVPGERLDEIEAKLIKAGFSKTDVEAAVAKDYQGDLFAGKPAEASLEGYIFPDTYAISSETSVSQLLQKTFDNFWQKVQQYNVVSQLQQQGLNLYQGITLASVVQKEAPNFSDQQVVAQVFLKRLDTDVPLGSDVTFMYAAHQLGVTATPSLDSPYNTRIYKGLPPGPIGNFNLDALRAVANPAATDYLYFVAGDNGKIYYSKTAQEHDAQTNQYCSKLCQ